MLSKIAKTLPKLPVSTWTGIVLLGLVVIYVGVASVMLYLPEDELVSYTGMGREKLFTVILDAPATTGGAYGHPILLALVAALCANMFLATLVRIRPSFVNAGAWISHMGVIVLAVGSLWYASAKISGDCASARVRGGWTPINHVYLPDKYSLYILGADRSRTRQVEIEGIGRGVDDSQPTAPVVKVPGGLKLRVQDYFPSARIEQQWKDDSPNPAPAVLVHISDSGHGRNILLCPVYASKRRFFNRRYEIRYNPSSPQIEATPPHDMVVITGTGKNNISMVIKRTDGRRQALKMPVGEEVQAKLGDDKIGLELLRVYTHARWASRAIPVSEDHPGARPAIRVGLELGDWSSTSDLPLQGYAHLRPFQLVEVPGGRVVYLNFARRRVSLPATVQITDAQFLTYPGMAMPRDYVCDVLLYKDERESRTKISLNNPLHVGPFQLSQNTWRPAGNPRPQQIILGAATRPALPIIWTGCAMVVAGFLYAFYVKPIILRRRRDKKS